jgi:hypothetical protein
MEKIEKLQNIYQEIHRKNFGKLEITSLELQQFLLDYSHPEQLIAVDCAYSNSNSTGLHTVIKVYKYREETDTEYEIRLKELERDEEDYDDTMTVDRRTYEEYKVKAWKYDQLNK